MVSEELVFGNRDFHLPKMIKKVERRIARGKKRHKWFKPGGSPFDMRFLQDTEVVYYLKPTAWRWANELENRFFLKAQNRFGIEQNYNPFTALRSIPDNPRMLSVTFDFVEEYESCTWRYNLGVVASQTMNGEVHETPVIIDPEGSAGTNGDIRE